MSPVILEARKERAWNSPEAIRRRELAKVNDDAAVAILRALPDYELAVHVAQLQADHAVKRAALQVAADSLARALNEKCRRGRG